MDERRLKEEKNKTEKALEESEAKYRSLFEESGEAIFLTDADTKILELNQTLADLLGFSKNEILGKEASTFFKNQDDWKIVVNRVRGQDIIRNIEVELQRKEGQIINGLVTIKVTRNDQGKAINLHGILRDITERKRGQRELEIIVTANAALRTAPDRASMLTIILDLIQDVGNAKGSALALHNIVSNELLIESAGGVWTDWKDKHMLPEEEISKAVYKSGELFRSDGIEKETRLTKPEIFKDISTIICLPLTTREQNIGILWIGSDEVITEDMLELIRVIMNIAANAIFRATLHENNIRALQESRTIANIGRLLNSNLDLEIIFQLIVDATIDIIPDSNRAIIHLFDEKNKRLHPVAISYVDKEAARDFDFPKIQVTPDGEFDFSDLREADLESAHMSRGKGIAGRVIDEGKTLNVQDTQSDSRHLHTGYKSDYRSMVVAPIQNADKRLGTISVLSNEPFTFTPTDEDLLENLCVQVTTAIENTRLLEAERIQRELVEAQAQISALMNQSLELEEVLDQILEHTLRVFSFKAANIQLVEDDKIKLARHKGYEVSDQEMEKYDLFLSELPAEDLVGIMYRTGEKIIISDTSNDPRWNPEMSFDWVKSYAGIPLKVGDWIIGFLDVDSDKPNFITDTVVQRLESFANDAANAVYNASLYKELETSLETEMKTRFQLIQADKLAGMGRMVASVAHELNNPLQTIKNCLFLIDQTFDDQEDTEILELARSEVERLSGIVGSLRDVYRPRVDVKFQPSPIAPLLADVAMLLEAHLRRNKVTWEKVPSDADYALINGFPDQLKQVFLNLSLNAIEAMLPDGGPLTIMTMINEKEKQIGVAFSDIGPGISEDAMNFIFEPFYTSKESGMGLGLSICYDITQNHNGHITVENNPDAGATFTVWLPLSETKIEIPSTGELSDGANYLDR